MTAEVIEIDHGEAPIEAAKAEVERILADMRFRATDRQRNILQYLATRRFTGCKEGVKAFSIAIDVLGRTSCFDSGTDPIVRIEMSRLRSALDAYYEAFGADHEVSIHIPKGSYVTLFPKAMLVHGPDEQHHSEGETLKIASGAAGANTEILSATAPHRFGRFETACATAGVVVLLVVAAAGIFAVFGAAPTPIGEPTVYLSMDAAQDAFKDEATQTREMLLAAMTQFQTLAVAKASPAAGRSPLADRAYEIDMKYYGDGDDRSVWWQIVDVASGNLLRSGLARVDTSGRSDAAVREDMAGSLARTFAAARGVINGIEMSQAPDDALGNPCVLRAEFALNQGSLPALAASARCLERTLALQPNDAAAGATLSRVMLAGDEGGTDHTKLRALELAKHATLIAPLSDRAQTALMVAQFAAGRPDAAIEAGNRAIAANPNNIDSAAQLAMVLYSSGYAEAGISMAREAAHGADAIPRAAALVLALDAYSRGQYSEASLAAEQINCADFIVQTLRTAALGQLGAGEAKTRLQELRDGVENFDQVSRRKLSASRLPAPLVAQLENGLVKAGHVAFGSTSGP